MLRRFPRPDRRGPGQLAEAVQGLAQGWQEGFESFRLDRIFDFVIISAAVESSLDDGHREWSAVSPHNGFEGFGLPLGDKFAREDFAIRLLAAELVGETGRQVVEIGLRAGVRQHEDVVGPDSR